MISVVTVNFKTADYLERMLASLFAHHGADAVEVIVVENASGDDLSALEERFPSVRFLYPGKNLGFAGGCNFGMAQANGDMIALINPDIVFDSPALDRMKAHMDAHPSVGIAGPHLKNLDGTHQDSVRALPRPSDQLLLLLKVPHVIGNVGPLKRWNATGFDYARTQDAEQVMGAFLCIRRALILDIGGLDQDFFMWYEEVDYCARARAAGWAVRYVADITARHKRGSSFERVSTLAKQAMLRRSLRRYMAKHHGFAAWLLFTLPEPIYVALAVGASALKPR